MCDLIGGWEAKAAKIRDGWRNRSEDKRNKDDICSSLDSRISTELQKELQAIQRKVRYDEGKMEKLLPLIEWLVEVRVSGEQPVQSIPESTM